MTNIFTKTLAIAATTTKAPKGRPDVKHGCNPCAITPSAQHGCNPRKTKTLLLALLLALLAPATAWAQFGGGTGKQTDPYIIRTTNHWIELADNVGDGEDYYKTYFRLDADLDFSGTTFKAVGSFVPRNERKFRGHFDGNGHTISNVTYTASFGSGLFGYAGIGSIKNLTLGGSSVITSSQNVGGIVSRSDRCTIVNCHVGSNVIVQANTKAAGGIVGLLTRDTFGSSGYGAVIDCTNEGTITGKSSIGGIIGHMSHPEIPITGCTNLGTVTGNSYVGGIVGHIDGDVLTNCHVDGNCTIGPIGVNGSSQGTTYGILPQIIYGEGVSGNIISLPAVTVHGDAYYLPGPSTIDLMLAYSGTVDEGYVVTYGASNDSLVFRGPHHELALPASGEVTISALPPMRDIGYASWVSINTPQQQYTGNPLSPVITVTDNMSSTPITLVENVDYEIIAPEGDCVYPGDYVFGVKGIGLYSGYTTTVFTIYHIFFQDGNGTAESPFLIFTTDDMSALADRVNAGDEVTGLHFRLEVDLDYTGKEYKPIGFLGVSIFMSQRQFRGIFDGNGHTISHVNIYENKIYDGEWHTSTNGLGLFPYLTGTVKNLRLADSQIISSGTSQWNGSNIGGIAGYVGEGTIDNCEVAGNVTIQGYMLVGGIAGSISYGTINKCVVGGDVKINGGTAFGGIVGRMDSSSTVTNNLSFGDISIVFQNYSYLGSIVGKVEGNNTLSNNYYVDSSFGGIGDEEISLTSVTGQAMRGYAVRGGMGITVALAGITGVAYNGAVYAGVEQSVNLYLDNEAWGCFSYWCNGSSLSNNGSYYTLNMPMEHSTIYATNIAEVVEMYGTYYRLACDDSNTAMVIYDDSYATAEAISVDDFEYQGTPYTVIGIDNYAFDGCTQLNWFDCHANLLSIGDFAFLNCDSLEYVGLYEVHTPPTVGEGAFDGLSLDTLGLMVPFCSQYDYAIHPVWGQFGTLFPDGNCEYNFTNHDGDRLWSNPDNWAGGEVPGEGAQVGIMNDCEVDTDVTAGSITIGSNYDDEYGYYERLTVKDGATLTASNFIYTAGDERNFVIEDGAQVIHNNAGAKATIEKTITAYTPNTKDGWHLIGFSFAENDTVAAMPNLMANSYDLYYYDEPTHYWMNHKYIDNGFTEMEPAKGYLYANSVSQTIGLKGTLEAGNATVNVPLDYTEEAGTLKGFNLVGNPFAHNVTTFTGNNVATDCYRMNDTKDDLTVSTISTTNPLLPGEGFFVKATGDNASVTFNGQTRGEKATTGRIALELRENGKLIDRFVVKRDGEPLEKLTLKENGTKIYSLREGQEMAVVPIEGNEQPVNFKAAKNGTYTLTVNVDNMDVNYLHLIDNMTGADINLLTTLNPETLIAGEDPQSPTPSYTFTAKTTDYASRFRLVFNAASTGSAADAPFAYIDASGNIIITGDAGTASLQIVDVMGRVIRTVGLSHCGSRTTTTGMTPGVYVLRLIDGENVRTQKIVVQ